MPDPGTVPIRSSTADEPAIVTLLSATLRGDPVLAWLHPDASAQQLADAATAAARQAITEARSRGTIDIAYLGPGRVDGVAVWSDHTEAAATTPALLRPADGITPALARAAGLGLLLDVEHPVGRHHDLLHLVLAPTLAGRAGVVPRLLGVHHDRLDAADLAAYAVVHRAAGRNMLLARGWQELRLLSPADEVGAACRPAWALRRVPGRRDRAGHEPGA
ncbi:hypothetical protein [Catenuloplanes indicus]|uniref:Uncharacterized protein n=1 Tax=Catenuloplanes indicus TaxID=137267 RepID=A0AAE3W087_9ACTN|nr:hypothetical protein [Catenuloplanes indicus]MDQ0366935.1 hypothetical protein [Catenuloplanes indicus]